MGFLGLALSSPTFADEIPWYKTEGIKSADIDTLFCITLGMGAGRRHQSAAPWKLILHSVGGSWGDMAHADFAELEAKKAYVADHYVLTDDDVRSTSKTLANGKWSVPWYVSAITLVPEFPVLLSGTTTLTEIISTLPTTPAGFADSAFVSQLMIEGGGTMNQTLEFETESNGHTFVKQMYSFATEINQKPREYVLCTSVIAIHIVDAPKRSCPPPKVCLGNDCVETPCNPTP